MRFFIAPTANFVHLSAPIHRTLMLGTLVSLLCFASCKNENTPAPAPETEQVELPTDRTHIQRSAGNLLIDGLSTDSAWTAVEWRPLDQFWIGKPTTPADFSGRYKVSYDDGFLYVLAEITDDSLTDTHPNGLERYWDDDCLEIFIDANGSGGTHQYDYNAFAYHLSLDGRVVDIAPDSSFQYFDQHITYKRTTTGRVSTWECACRIYDDNYTDLENSVPQFLKLGKQMGFMLAYCDNDRSKEREHFIGSTAVAGEDKNRGWIDASVFEKVVLGY
jgi:Carbohydrate family 9 binding domain-like